jgi:NADH dehydrogenase [ubiquinone] 1 alpha subcomplex assembly factor 2
LALLPVSLAQTLLHRFPSPLPSPAFATTPQLTTPPGTDLDGNTFWEFRDRLAAHRPRRIVEFSDASKDWVDYAAAVSPAWHQWLRATRIPPPTIAEQVQDVQRREVMRQRAAIADAKWAAKPSLLKAPPHPPKDSVMGRNTKFAGDSGLQRENTGEKMEHAEGKTEDRVGKAENPWAKAEEEKAGGFQAGEWDPNVVVPKRRGR